jgi:DNA-binding transcriptional MerR regulator
VLRFWESKFSQVKPLKRGGGRRYYRPEDVELLRSIRTLLYRDGYTIKGVQKLMREGHIARESDPGGKSRPGPDGYGRAEDDRAAVGTGTSPDRASAAGLDARQRREIEAVIDELTEIRKLLRV